MLYYVAANQTLTPGFKNIVVCNCNIWPAGLHVCNDIQPIKVNVTDVGGIINILSKETNYRVTQIANHKHDTYQSAPKTQFRIFLRLQCAALYS
jgi:hypothetical protein